MSDQAGGRGAVVITGASTGIGRTTAHHLDKLGFRVFAGVRRAQDGEALREGASDRLSPILIDVTNEGSIAAAAKEVTAALGENGLAGLVNNAGIVVSGPLEFTSMDEWRRQFEVNFFGFVAVTQTFLPLLRKARGRIVNISSIGGRVASPFIGPYAASKYAMEGASDALRRELRGTGVQVSLIEPGAIATPIWEKGQKAGNESLAALSEEALRVYGKGLTKLAEAAEKMSKIALPPERVAEVVAHALTSPKPKTRYLVGKEAKIQKTLSSLLGDRLFDGFMARFLGMD
ncbi:MAG: SDR family NAD(P)-dependent oxidoreductase [Deltaproteobacteria bacterium]|nr:SDR family NAD(P)-dependent oxidoreductase [Deltaproteobacteria bacterium]